MKHVVFTNAAANWLGYIANVVVMFIASPLLVHGLGDQRYGIWAFVDSILAYLTLLDLGIGASVVRYVARFEAVSDRDQLNRTFSTSLAIFIGAGAAGMAFTGLLLGPAWPLLRVPQPLAQDTWWLLAILGFNLAVALPLGVFAVVLDGLQRYTPKVAVRTVLLIIRAWISVVIVQRGGGLIPLAVVITVCSMIAHLSLAGLTFYYLPVLRFSLSLVDRETFRTIRGYSMNAFLAMIAGRLSFQTDALVIGVFLAPEQITYFVLGARLVEYAKDMFRAVTTVLTPLISQKDALGDREAIRRVLKDGSRWLVWLIVPVQVGLWVLGRPFLDLWMGAEYGKLSTPVLLALSAPLMLVITQFVSARILYGMGDLRFFTVTVIGEAVANLILSIILVKPLGILGVALGTLIPNLLSNLLVIGRTLKMLEIPVFRFFVQTFLRPVVCAVVPAAIWLIAAGQEGKMSWTTFLAVGVLGLSLYLVLAALNELGSSRLYRSSGSIVRRFLSFCFGSTL